MTAEEVSIKGAPPIVFQVMTNHLLKTFSFSDEVEIIIANDANRECRQKVAQSLHDAMNCYMELHKERRH